MSLIITLFCIENALTSAVPLVDSPSSNSTSVLGLIPTASTNQRSTWDILWSCLATIFACTWLSIHPNMPSPKDGRIRIALQRLELMVWAIMTPEMIIFWAMRQWQHARDIAKLYEGYGWTTTHAHFLLMGGFVLAEGAHDTSVLTPIKFRRLLADQEIGFPLISEREIQDRSKGDGLSKALVVLQTTWFISQCISRKVQGLTITEIELVTVAFAFLNGIMYFLWWSKPVDVTTSVRIYRLTSPIPHPPAISIAREPEIPSSSIKIRITTSVTTRETGSSDQLSLTSSTPTPQITTPPMAHALLPISGSIQLVESRRPLSQQILPSSKQESRWHISIHLMRAFLFVFNRLNEMRGELKPYSWAEPTRIPTFFPPGVNPNYAYGYHLGVAIISILFGLIHCLGWSLIFPSGAERLIWRVSAVIISALPVLVLFSYSILLLFVPLIKLWRVKGIVERPFLFLFVRCFVLPVGRCRIVLWWIFVALIPIYLLARIALLVEAFLSLRNLPPGAYSVVNWTNYLPHI